jgi:hypothetical protein
MSSQHSTFNFPTTHISNSPIRVVLRHRHRHRDRHPALRPAHARCARQLRQRGPVPDHRRCPCRPRVPHRHRLARSSCCRYRLPRGARSQRHRPWRPCSFRHWRVHARHARVHWRCFVPADGWLRRWCRCFRCFLLVDCSRNYFRVDLGTLQVEMPAMKLSDCIVGFCWSGGPRIEKSGWLVAGCLDRRG